MGRATYGLKVREITGAPSWVNSDPYDIQAKASDEVVAELNSMSAEDRLVTQRKMLQNLLTDRLRMSYHFEDREVPAYNLEISKTGIRRMKLEAETAETKRDFELTKRSFTADTMEDIALSLTRWMECPVADRTGLLGKYDLTLQWTPDPVPTDGGVAPPYEPGPYIRKALADYGLVLQPTKVRVPELVIDHIERPSKN